MSQSTSDAARHAGNKRHIHNAFKALARASVGDTEKLLQGLYASDAKHFASHPMNEMEGVPTISSGFWRPLKTSFPDLERIDTLVVGGTYQENDMVACLGRYQGTFEFDWLGIPATHKVTSLRYGEAHLIRGDKIVHSWTLIDVLDVIRQAGLHLVPESLGAEGFWPAPDGGRGLELDGHDEAGGDESFKLVRGMHAALLDFDGKDLRSMKLDRWWTKHFNWYGPSGIGATQGLSGFEAHHQIPFLKAFPDRKGGLQHYIRIAEGQFVVTGGWPSVTATHTGGGWLGMPASGRKVGMRVMDFYRCEDGLIAENWVPIDITDLLLQMGYDVLERIAHLRGNPRRSVW